MLTLVDLSATQYTVVVVLDLVSCGLQTRNALKWAFYCIFTNAMKAFMSIGDKCYTKDIKKSLGYQALWCPLLYWSIGSLRRFNTEQQVEQKKNARVNMIEI